MSDFINNGTENPELDIDTIAEDIVRSSAIENMHENASNKESFWHKAHRLSAIAPIAGGCAIAKSAEITPMHNGLYLFVGTLVAAGAGLTFTEVKGDRHADEAELLARQAADIHDNLNIDRADWINSRLKMAEKRLEKRSAKIWSSLWKS